MEITKLGPLRARIVRGGRSSARKHGEESPGRTVVLLHGFGAPGDDLVALAGALDAPETTFVFPEAPHDLADLAPLPFYGDARAWWMVDVGRYERAQRSGRLRELTRDVPDGLAEARAAVIAMLDALGARGDLVLGGFSQGAMLSLDVALHDARPLAGLVLLSGTLIAEDEWLPRVASRAGLPIFQSHGESDPLLPFAIAETLRDALVERGADVTFEPFDGPHTIPPATLRALARWLEGLPKVRG